MLYLRSRNAILATFFQSNFYHLLVQMNALFSKHIDEQFTREHHMISKWPTTCEAKEVYWDKTVCVRGFTNVTIAQQPLTKIANVSSSHRRYSFIVQVYQGRHHLTHIWPVLSASYKSSWFTTPPLKKGNKCFVSCKNMIKLVRRRCTTSKNRALLDIDVTILVKKLVEVYLLVLTNTALLFILEKASLLNIPIYQTKQDWLHLTTDNCLLPCMRLHSTLPWYTTWYLPLPVIREFTKPRRRRQGQRQWKNEFILYPRISRYCEVIYFVYHCQNYHKTKSRTQR